MSDNNTTALAQRNESLALFGDRADVREMFARIKQMIPGAAKAPDGIVLLAAQKAIAHGLDIMDDEIYLFESKGVWKAHVAVKGQRRNAEGLYHFQDDDDFPRRLSDDEMKADFGASLKAGTIGIEVRMYNLRKARQMKEIGIPYSPRREKGFWVPGENVPATRSPAWVAQKRAEATALRAEFPLKYNNASPEQAAEYLEFKDRQLVRQQAIPANRPRLSEAEMDGEIPEVTYRQPADDGEFIELDGEADVDFGMGGGDEPPPPSAPSTSSGQVLPAGWLDYLHNLHTQSNGPASPEMHKFLCGTLDTIAGQDAHRDLLQVIVGREVTLQNPEGYDLCKELLNNLVELRTDKETGARIRNPKHDPTWISYIKVLWNQVLESKGQMTMPLEEEAVPY